MLTASSRACLILAALCIALLMLMGSLVLGQVDPSKALVGTWTGRADVRRDPDRTLIIKSVKPAKDGGWVADSHYGTTGKGLAHLKIAVSSQEDHLILDFMTSADNPAKLKLYGDRVLEGTLSVRDGTGARAERKLKLGKVSDK